MVITAVPQLEVEQDVGVALVGAVDGIDDVDIPPPQALKVAASKAVATGNHRCRITHV
jgi:hypothetical protein